MTVPGALRRCLLYLGSVDARVRPSTGLLAITLAATLSLGFPAADQADVPGASWTDALGSAGPIAVAPNGNVLTSDCNDVARSGSYVWRLPDVSAQPPSCGGAGITDSEGNSYVMTIDSSSGEAVAESLDPSGAVRWKTLTNGFVPFRTGPVLGADGDVYFSAWDGGNPKVLGYDEKTGAKTFEQSYEDVTGLHAWTGGLVIVDTDSRIAYVRYDGSLEDEYSTGEPISAYEAYSNAGGANGTVFVAGYDGGCDSASHASVEEVTPAGVAWTWTDPATYCSQTGLAATTDGGVVLARDDGGAEFTSLNAAGTTRWTQHPSGPIGPATGAGYFPVRVDARGVVALPTMIIYHCAAQPTEECSGDQVEFATQQTGATAAAPVQLTGGTEFGYTLSSIAIDAGRLYADGSIDEMNNPASLASFAVPNLAVDYQLTLQEALTGTAITPAPTGPGLPPPPPSTGTTGAGGAPLPVTSPCAPVRGGLAAHLLANLKCTYELSKLARQCAVGVASLIILPLKSLRLVEAAKNISVITKLPKRLRPVAKLLYDVYHAKYLKHAPPGVRSGSEAVDTLHKVRFAWELLKIIPDLARAVTRADLSEIALDLDEIAGLQACVQAVADVTG
jgi:hypothetical protein